MLMLGGVNSNGQGASRAECKVSNQKLEAVIEYGYRYLLACREEK